MAAGDGRRSLSASAKAGPAGHLRNPGSARSRGTACDARAAQRQERAGFRSLQARIKPPEHRAGFDRDGMHDVITVALRSPWKRPRGSGSWIRHLAKFCRMRDAVSEPTVFAGFAFLGNALKFHA